VPGVSGERLDDLRRILVSMPNSANVAMRDRKLILIDLEDADRGVVGVLCYSESCLLTLLTFIYE